MTKYDENMGIGIVFDNSEIEHMHYCMIFDEYVDEEVRLMELQIKEEKVLKRVCLVKTICYPFEILITYLLLGKNWVKERNQQQRLFNSYIRGKIKFKDFQLSLMQLTKQFLENKNA